MWGASQRFFDTLARTRRQLSYVEVLQNGVTVATFDSKTLPDPVTGQLVQSIGGSVQVDRTSVRRSGSVDLMDISSVVGAGQVSDLFPPLITEVRLWVGVRYWDAAGAEGYAGTVSPSGVITPGNTAGTEFVPVGTLVVSTISDNFPSVTLSGYDRMWMVGPFARQFTVAKGASIADSMNAVIRAQLPAGMVDTSGIFDVDATLPATVYAEQDDAADALHAMALAGGQLLYVDPMGAFTTAPEPTTDDDPVATYAPGPLSMLMRPQRTVDASNAYNAVVFTSEPATGTPKRGYAQDDDPTSATYVLNVGVRPYFASSPLMTTQAQVNQAAKTRLQNILGFPETLAAPIIPNPALESGDVVLLRDPDQGIDFPVIVDSFTVSMRADGPMTLTCRGRVIK